MGNKNKLEEEKPFNPVSIKTPLSVVSVLSWLTIYTSFLFLSLFFVVIFIVSEQPNSGHSKLWLSKLCVLHLVF